MRRSWMGLFALLVGVLVWNAAAQSEEEKPNPGKELFVSNKCNSCHMVSKEGIEKRSAAAAAASAEKGDAGDGDAAEEADASKSKKRKYPDLSGVGLTHDAEWMTKYLQKVEAKDGKKHMKKFRGTDEELGTLTAWLASLKHEMKEGGDGSEETSEADEASDAGEEKASDAESGASEEK